MQQSEDTTLKPENVRKARQMAAQLIEDWDQVNDEEKIGTVSEIVHQLAAAESGEQDTAKTIEAVWEENNQPFDYTPPEEPPERWDSEDYTELFDRYIRRSTDWICGKCNQPFGTLRKARSHVRSNHQERLINNVISMAGYAEEDDTAADEDSSRDRDIEKRKENNSQLTEFEDKQTTHD